MAAFPEWEWQLVSMPARYFNWRIRGNALYLSQQYAGLLAEPWDLIVATSMTDLAGLRSLCPSLTRVPAILYFHENQFAYPVNAVQAARLEPQMMTLFSALSADRLVFNSRYNRDSFIQGVRSLMAKLPDAVPPQLAEQLLGKSEVLPVPLKDSAFLPVAERAQRPALLWNHRWEHDKAPERFYRALCLLGNRVSDLQVHVVGQQFRKVPPVFEALRGLIDDNGWQGAWGYQHSRTAYEALLARSHCVVSTALHDFQGLSVLEAVAAGASAVLPARLAYPEWFERDGAAHFYASYEAEAEREAEALAQVLVDALCGAPTAPRPATGIQMLSWSALRPAYVALFTKLTG